MSRPFRPSNSDHGAWFEDRFCDRCERDRAYREERGDSCPILGNALAFDIDDPHYPKEWIEEDDGSNPRCTAFQEEGNGIREPSKS